MSPADRDGARNLVVVVVVAAVLLAGGVVYARLVWNKADYVIFFVPSTPLFWAFTGGSVRVLYGLISGSRREAIYTWALVRPIIGAAMGAFACLALVSGLVLVQSSPPPSPSDVAGDPAGADRSPLRPEFVCALAFVAGYSDRFSMNLLERITGSFGAGRRGPDKPPDRDAPEKPKQEE
jgi:hypothetical protein